MADRASGFAAFMASAAGRGLRIVAGASLVFWGWSMQSGTGTIVMILGLVPIAAGAFNFCLVAPLLNVPFWGRKIRGDKNNAPS